MLLYVLLSHFFTRPKDLCRKTFPLVRSSDFSLVERWEGTGSSRDLLTSLNPDNPNCREGNTLFCRLSCPIAAIRALTCWRTPARCISSWNLPSACSWWESPLKTPAVRPSWGDVRTNGGEHVFTSCGRNSSLQNQKELFFPQPGLGLLLNTFFFLSQIL